eukprot:tig00021073_g18033.t1
MLEEPCFRAAGSRLRLRTLANASLSTSLLPLSRWLRRRSKGGGVTGPREQKTTAQFAWRLLPQASAAHAALRRTCGCWRSRSSGLRPLGRSERFALALALALAVAVAGILAVGQARAGLLLPLLAERSGLGEVPHDPQRARAGSLHALPSHVNP